MMKENDRKSNFELLRIVSMLMIFVYHYCIHGGIIDVGSYTINKLIALFLFVYGRVGVNLFIILSGYFLIDSKFKIKKLIKLILQIIFYSILMQLLSNYRMQVNFTKENFITSCMPVYFGVYWFATCYIVVYLISPFLNKMIKSISKNDCKKIIVVGLIILSLVPSLHLKNNFICSEFIWYIFIYFIGACIKIHKFEFKKDITSKFICMSYPFVSYFIMIVLILINKHFNLNLDQYYFCGINSIVVFVGTIGIFMFFKNMKLRDNKIINYLAKIGFATYLVSDNLSYKKIFWHIDCKTLEFTQKPAIIFILHIILCVIFIWTVVAIIEFIRINIFERNIFKIKIFNKYFDKIDEFMQT